MENKSVRESLRWLANDAREWAGGEDDNIEIVDRQEAEIIAYIEGLEEDRARLRGLEK